MDEQQQLKAENKKTDSADRKQSGETTAFPRQSESHQGERTMQQTRTRRKELLGPDDECSGKLAETNTKRTSL